VEDKQTFMALFLGNVNSHVNHAKYFG